MIKVKVRMTFIEHMLGTASGNPDIHKEYIASNAPDAATMKEEVEAIGTEGVFEKSMTVFPRDKDGTPIVYDYQLKGLFKDSCKSLKKIPNSECGKIKAYKQEIDGLIFVSPRKIPITLPKGGEIEICQRPLRASTAQGERIALASSEMVPEGSSIEFEILMLADGVDAKGASHNVHEKAIMEILEYGRLRGFGQWRNSGAGRFTYEILSREVCD